VAVEKEVDPNGYAAWRNVFEPDAEAFEFEIER
jgi:hypothetical protein